MLVPVRVRSGVALVCSNMKATAGGQCERFVVLCCSFRPVQTVPAYKHTERTFTVVVQETFKCRAMLMNADKT